ncbi:DUF3142 domain-containing protein [Luteolibacter ambystomatis]|uniref:DUF3142 domain-containing protein n=1 Tax=Luteolibacter ambystomatis TaxID=2824561 RepID=A0A975G7A2_9BACT|nr:DUF3142 domain-containing protein [Luteolibacter ambystomatis]QUE50268.1 DUF3142 domain-containing protein [Luteolibacter ambystomatis]
MGFAFPVRAVIAPLLLAALSSCDKTKPAEAPATASGPMVQRAYVWQRDWRPEVSRSIAAHGGAFDSLAVLAAQIEWKATGGEPSVVRPPIDWGALRAAARPAGLVARVQRAGEGRMVAEAVIRVLLERLAEAKAASVPVSEFQIDYDCAQKNLEGYRQWLASVREGLRSTGVPLRITTLPSWLGEPAFEKLVDGVDGYVLQVHSFDLTALGKAPTVCDPVMAREWVARAAKLGRPFHVALPTYSCIAGYGPDGRCLGMVADAGHPTWRWDARVVEFTSDSADLAGLVAEWTKQRPAMMQGLYWYRLPVDGETYNWRWPTLAAVMSGRVPMARWEIKAAPGSPVDFVLWNTGEKDDLLPRSIRVTRPGPPEAVVADGLGGWQCKAAPDHVDFQFPTQGRPIRLAPGNSMPLGWIRYQEPPPPDMTFSYEIVR